MEKFKDERDAIAYFEKALWCSKPKCPRSEGTNTIPRPERKGHFCNQCRTSFSIKVGTIFEKSKLSLSVWLAGFYIILTSRKGVSSVQLSKELGVTQKTSWFLQHRIREACTEDTELLLKGAIEADETYIGGLEKQAYD